MKIKNIVLLFTVFWASVFGLQAQSEQEVIQQANTLFKEEKFIEATPLFLRLLSLDPKNTTYNYKYGACLLYNANKKQESLKYIKFAINNSDVNPEAYYFAGRAYHQNYLFNDAVRSFDKYLTLIDKKESSKYDIPRLIEMCQNGRKLLTSYSELIVYDKKEIEKDKFFRLYDLKDIGGNILVTADFQTKVDKKKNHIPLVYFPKSANEIFYSSYGESEENGKDIYRRLRKSSGGWEEPQLVAGNVNTKFDEDFAYRSQDGKYLYFSSKGHNSMGGYDVFRCAYDASTDSFLEAENMDFAISSPDDDIFFLVDKKNENGYFASARQSEVGKLYVYKIRVDKIPTEISIIAGKFESKINGSGTKLLLDVVNEKNTSIGTFRSDEDGKIVMKFPSSGFYKYVMKLDGNENVFTQNVTIPAKKTLKPLRQNIVHFMENGKETIRILDRFDEVVVEKDDILAEVFMDKSSLDPNSQNYNVDEIQNEALLSSVLSEIGAKGLSFAEIGENLQNKLISIQKTEEQSKRFQQKTATGLQNELKNISAIDKKMEENIANIKAAGQNSMSKEKLLEESKVILVERENAVKRIESLISVNEKMQDYQTKTATKKAEAEKLFATGQEIKRLLAEDKNLEVLNLIDANKKMIKEGLELPSSTFQENLSLELNQLNVSASEINKRIYNYETSSKDLQNNIDILERTLYDGSASFPESTKESLASKKKDLNIIQTEIKSLNSELEKTRSVKNTISDELSAYSKIESVSEMGNDLSFNDIKNKATEVITNGSEYSASDLLAINVPETKNTNVELLSSKAWSDKVFPDFDTQLNQIESQSSISTQAKLEQNKAIREKLQIELVKELKSQQEELSNNPNDSNIKQNLVNLKQLISNNEADLALVSQNIDAEKNLQLANNLTENNVIEQLDVSYTTNLTRLSKDLSGGEVAMLQSLNDLDRNFVQKIEKRKTALLVEKEKSIAENNLISKELEYLSTIQEKTDKEISLRENQISEIENQLAVNNNEVIGEDTPELVDTPEPKKSEIDSIPENRAQESKWLSENFDILTEKEQESLIFLALDTEFETKKQALLNSDLSDIQKWNQQIEANSEALKKLEKLSLTLESNNIAQKKAIEKLEKSLSNENTELALNISAGPEESAEMIARLDANYFEQKKVLNAKTEDLEKNKQLIELNNDLITSLDKEKAKFEKLKLEYPNNPVFESKMEEIDQLKSEIAQEVSAYEIHLIEVENSLASNPDTPEPEQTNIFANLSSKGQEEEIIKRVQNDYLEEQNRIQSLQIPIEDKLKKKLDLDRELITSLQKEKRELNGEQRSAERDAIDRLLKSTNQQISANETELENVLADAIADLNNMEDTPEYVENPIENNPSESSNNAQNSFASLTIEAQEKELLQRTIPLYLDYLAAIDNSQVSTKEKLNQKISEQNKLINSLATEKEKLDKTKQESEFQAFLRLEEKINKDLVSNQMELIALPESAESLFGRLAPDYQRNKQQLFSNPNLPENEKLKRQMEVDQLMVQTLVKEKTKISNLFEANPTIINLQKKEISIAETIENLEKEISKSKSKLENPLAVIPNNSNQKYKVIGDIRNEFLGSSNSNLLESTPKMDDLAELKSILEKLEKYQVNLETLQNEINNSSPETVEGSQFVLNMLSSEIATVEIKKRQYSVWICDLETNILAKNEENSESEKSFNFGNNQLERLHREEEELKVKIKAENSIKEIKKLEKQIVKLEQQITLKETELLESENRRVVRENESKLGILEDIQPTSVVERVTLELAETRANDLMKDASQLESLAKNSKNVNEAKELINRAVAKQNQANELLETAILENRITKITDDKISSLFTQSELEQRKVQLLMEESNYNSEILNVDAELKKMNNPEAEKQLFEKRAELLVERQLILDQIASVDNKMSGVLKPLAKTIKPEMKDTEISYPEEILISSSLEYKEIAMIANDALFLENEISYLIKSIDKEKQVARQLIENSNDNFSKETQKLITEKINEIQKKEARVAELKSSLVKKKTTLANIMPADQSKKAKIENLILRGIDPVASSVSDYVSVPKEGLTVANNVNKIEKRELAIGSQIPSGLLFRVQVGAFSKPVANDAFQEFSPVTGEKRDNGMVVYLAGYFDKSKSASDAQKTIRSLGYTDAFVVAYCDGQRIALAEGRRLEETKSCIPVQVTELKINRTAPVELKDTTKLIARELDYNKGIGAVSAVPIELKKGLFYTVQIGVFNRPVDPATIKNMTPLISKRLPNGQIRYSAGVYVSLEDAMPKRQEAIEKGIQDAFITAYYGSERISLTEAESLLLEKGTGIIERTAIGIVKDVAQRQKAEEILQEVIEQVELKRFKEGMRIQLVSKESFEEFPRDKLNRFNKHASFYFDQNDKRLKSTIFYRLEDIPQIHFLREEVDTVFFTELENIQLAESNGYRKLVFYVPNGGISGDLADYLFRLNFRKEYMDQGQRMKITLHNVPSDAIQRISDQLRTLKIRTNVE